MRVFLIFISRFHLQISPKSAEYFIWTAVSFFRDKQWENKNWLICIYKLCIAVHQFFKLLSLIPTLNTSSTLCHFIQWRLVVVTDEVLPLSGYMKAKMADMFVYVLSIVNMWVLRNTKGKNWNWGKLCRTTGINNFFFSIPFS